MPNVSTTSTRKMNEANGRCAGARHSSEKRLRRDYDLAMFECFPTCVGRREMTNKKGCHMCDNPPKNVLAVLYSAHIIAYFCDANCWYI